MESLLLRLLKAVLMPITIRYFLFPIDSETLNSSATGEPLSKDSCRVLAAELIVLPAHFTGASLELQVIKVYLIE